MLMIHVLCNNNLLQQLFQNILYNFVVCGGVWWCVVVCGGVC